MHISNTGTKELTLLIKDNKNEDQGITYNSYNNVNLKNGDCNKYFSNLSHWQKIQVIDIKVRFYWNLIKFDSFAAMDAFKINLKILPFLYKHFFLLTCISSRPCLHVLCVMNWINKEENVKVWLLSIRVFWCSFVILSCWGHLNALFL